jgi:hypothetical protein
MLFRFLSAVVLLNLIGCPSGSTESSGWAKYEGPVYKGIHDCFAADPCVFKHGGLWYMFYTDFDINDPDNPDDDSTGLCTAVSEDVYFWDPANCGPDDFPSAVPESREDSWEEKIETVCALPFKNNFYLFYSGYPRGGFPPVPGEDPLETMGSDLGLASGNLTDGFIRTDNNPVLERTSDRYDEDSLFSPTIIVLDDTWYMIYTGHFYADNPEHAALSGVYLLGAVSTDNGLTWIKQENPVLVPASQRVEDDPASRYAWMKAGVAEASLMEGPDGLYYLFFQGMSLNDVLHPHVIGMARAPHPLGPFEIYPDPILKPEPGTIYSGGTIAPHAVYDQGKTRIYYNALSVPAEESWVIGCAEKDWPIWPEEM